MTKQEQIEEMTKIMCKECVEATAMTCRFTKEEVPCDFAKCFAEALYNAGYRKADDIRYDDYRE